MKSNSALRVSVLHVDADAFAASVERVLNPALRGRPLVIGAEGGGRGLVTCASYEARRLGIHPGMPVSAARRRFPDAIFLPGNPARYEAFSRRLFEALRARVPVAEAASLDDFFLDLTGCERLFGGDLLGWSAALARSVAAEVGIPVSMGLAPNKMLARIATRLAKPGHVLHVPAGCERDFLAPVAVRLLPGVGREGRRRLREFGVQRIGQLAALGEERLHLLFGPAGSTLLRRAQGECHEPVRNSVLDRTFSTAHLFDQDTAAPEVLEGAADLLAQKLAWTLRRHGLLYARATLELTYADGAVARSSVCPDHPTDREQDLAGPVRTALRTAFHRRVRVRSLRLIAPLDEPAAEGQADLFHEEERRRDRSLHRAIDQIRARHGFRALITAPGLLAVRVSHPPRRR